MKHVTAAAPLSRLVSVVLWIFLLLTPADQVQAEGNVSGGELYPGCVVSILNRNTLAGKNGRWLLPNVPAGFGKVRARATCVTDGVTRFGESEPFEIPARGSVNVPRILLGMVTPVPTLLTLTASATTLTSPEATAQLTANAVFQGGTNRNVTASSSGTTYLSSNPAIVSVSSEGLVRAVTSGTAIIQASYEGASGLVSISVVLSADSDGDGIADDVELREGLDPNNPVDALEDLDHDGLINREEVQLGTQLRNADTDGDTIADGEEVIAGQDGFVTSPLLADTDGDGIRDGLEVTTGSNPTDRNSYDLARALNRIEFRPPFFTLVVNTLINEASTQLRVVGRLQDGTTIDLTESRWGTSYASSDLAVCNFGGTAGRVHAASNGTCTITASNNRFRAAASGLVRTFTPRPVSWVAIPGYANNVEVSQDYAYVAAGSTGLQVVRVLDKASPAIVGSRDTPGNANDVRISGRYAYVADGSAGLQVIDIINPLEPSLVGGADTPGDASDVMISEGVAYVADGSRGLALIDVRSPTAPRLLGSLVTGGTARGVDVSGSYALLADDSPAPALRVIDVTNPVQPRLVGSVALAGYPKDVRVRGSQAYVAAFTGGVQVVDFSEPASPRVIGRLPDAFVPRDVELAERFAIFAEQLFPNVVPFVDVSTPASPAFRGILDFAPLGDYAGTGIDVNGSYVYMTAEYYYVYQENGTTANSRLFIGQYLPTEDQAGLPPQVSLTSPQVGATHYVGDQVRISATASDDVGVSFVSFSINGEAVFTDTSAPYEYTFTLSAVPAQLELAVTAVDLSGNQASAMRTIEVQPDPVTTVSGVVVDEAGVPLAGATVTTVEARSTVSSATGAFSITGVSARQPDLFVTARYTLSDGTLLTGSSLRVAPVRGGVTSVGTIVLLVAQFEADYGTLVDNCDDCSVQRPLPFPFTFYGVTYNNLYVGSNGYLTFTSTDTAFSESVWRFISLPRIAGFFDDLMGPVYVNDQLPGRFIVTYDRMEHYDSLASNTLQITLYADGRVLLGYRGITSLTTGTITGLSPGYSTDLQEVNFSDVGTLELPANAGVYEYFSRTHPFDLDNAFVLFTPRSGGGYNVRTLQQPISAGVLRIAAAPSGVNPSTAALGADAASEQNEFALAEAEVTSSGDASYRGMANTDARGVLALTGVPPGGINIVLRKRGVVVGQGAAVLGPPEEGSSVPRILLQSPVVDTKAEESNP